MKKIILTSNGVSSDKLKIYSKDLKEILKLGGVEKNE